MKTLVVFIFVCIFAHPSIFGQIIKIENGMAISSINSTKFDVLEKHITTYSISVGLDYWENKTFYMSSEIGYLRKGGKQQNDLLPENFKNIKESWDYIHSNTTIRFPFQLRNNSHFFIGVGPKLDFLIGANEFKSPVFTGYSINSISFGAKGEFGFVQDFDRIRTGVNFSYLYDLSRAGGTEFIDLRNNVYQIKLSVGYRI